jgi:hypothetical protein
VRAASAASHEGTQHRARQSPNSAGPLGHPSAMGFNILKFRQREVP